MNRTIIYSSTRQWNPGDEFILFGVRNLLTSILGEHNPVIYNRHPDIRPNEEFIGLQMRHGHKNDQEDMADIYLRRGFNDNSLKYDTDSSFADLAVFAGTPEWTNKRCYNFYYHILKNSLPVLILGAGYAGNVPPFIEEVVSKASVFTVRDARLTEHPFVKKHGGIYLPCPALFTAPEGTERRIREPDRIGITFGVPIHRTVPCNGIDYKVYKSLEKTYTSLIQKYSGRFHFSVICHYIDEIAEAHRLFDPLDVPVFYSYDARDYAGIYRNHDAIISTRVHACGIAASIGIPSICFIHDARGTTCNGFLSETVSPFLSFEDFDRDIFLPFIKKIPRLNEELISHKKHIFNSYCNVLKKAAIFKRPSYTSRLELRHPDEVLCDRILYDVAQLMTSETEHVPLACVKKSWIRLRRQCGKFKTFCRTVRKKTIMFHWSAREKHIILFGIPLYRSRKPKRGSNNKPKKS